MPVAIPCFRVNQSTCPGFGELSRKRIPNSASGGLPPRPSLMVDIYESLIDRMGGSEQEFLNGFVSVLANSSLADAVTIIAIGIDHSQAPICLASEGEDFALRCQSGKDLSRVREAAVDRYPSLFTLPDPSRSQGEGEYETFFLPLYEGVAVIAISRGPDGPPFDCANIDALTNLCGLLTFSREEICRPSRDIDSRAPPEWESETLSLAASVAGLGLWDWDISRDKLRWSDEHFRLEGYEVGEIEPSYQAWLDRVHPEDRDETVNALSRAMTNNTKFRHEFRSVHPDGSIRWLLGSGRFFYDERGEATRMIGAMMDITDAREATSNHRRIVDELEHRLASVLSLTRYVFTCSIERAPNYQWAVAHFPGRVDAIARAEKRAARSVDSTVDLEGLSLDELDAAFPEYAQKTQLSGPRTRVSSSLSRDLSLAVHELAINAFEHGVFSNADGLTEIFWEVNLDQDGNRYLTLQWTEKEVRLIQVTGLRPGFGMEFLEKEFCRRTGADVDLSVKRGGVAYRAELPLDRNAEPLA